MLAGLITGNELRSGIDHALALAVRRDLASSTFVGEAIWSDGGAGPIPEGARLAIPASTPMPSTITSVPGKTLWKAMVEYGAFVVDIADGAQAGYFVADSLSVNHDDVATLLGPHWTAAELAAIGHAARIVR